MCQEKFGSTGYLYQQIQDNFNIHNKMPNINKNNNHSNKKNGTPSMKIHDSKKLVGPSSILVTKDRESPQTKYTPKQVRLNTGSSNDQGV